MGRSGTTRDPRYAEHLEDALHEARSTWRAAVQDVAARLRSAVLPYLEQHGLSLRPDRGDRTWYVDGPDRRSVDPSELPAWLDQLLRVEVEPGANPPDYLAYYLDSVHHAEAAATTEAKDTGGPTAEPGSAALAPPRVTRSPKVSVACPDQWTRMQAADGALTLGVRVNNVDRDIVFTERDLSELHKLVVVAVVQQQERRQAQRGRAQERKPRGG